MDTTNDSYQDASDMLAEALKQMDGILAGTLKREHKSKTANGLIDPGSPPYSPRPHVARAAQLVDDLQATLDGVEDRCRIFRQLSPGTQSFLQSWVTQTSNHALSNGYSSSENLDDKIRRLENDKDNLSLQVSVLSDQIEAQVEKIRDLERLTRSQRNGNTTPTNGPADMNGDIHGLELINRNMPTSDMHKLDLMAENSSLKLRLAGLEREKADYESRTQYAQRRIDDLQSRLNDQTIELNELRMRVAKNGTIPRSPEQADRDRTLERDRTLDRLKKKHSEVEKLKKAVESLMVTNSEKDHYIDDLKRQMNQMQDNKLAPSSQRSRDLGNINHTEDQNGHEMYTTQRERYDNLNNSHNISSLHPNATSTPSTVKSDSPTSAKWDQTLVPSMHTLDHSPKRPTNVTSVGRSNSFENVKHRNGTPPLIRPSQGFGVYAGSFTDDEAQTETDEEALKDEMAQEYKQLQKQKNNPEIKKQKSKGIKRFFGKLKRSNSQEMDPDKLEDFKRSGLRATAGARLGWSHEIKTSDMDIPFTRWDSERVATWFHALGLSMYVGECKRWVRNGQHLLDCTAQDMEKELGMRNHFHRKKLHLALQSVGADTRSPMDCLDFNWVTRWLDDIGLPQYKDMFLDARVDGRMLHNLTVEDLVTLKVTNTLHHLSIRRGIEVLRLNDFNPACLKRRPVPDESNNGELQNVPRDVMLWTNHRVMEWLRSIDLSEYAPNLRGSGVHGGLMVLEPRFSYEIFASLLSIPSNKTLLRRHLSTHYVTLIGSEMQQRKRELQAQPGYTPLTPNQKVKLKKRLFSHRRTRSECADEELLCPVDGQESDTVVPSSSSGSPVWSRDAKNGENEGTSS